MDCLMLEEEVLRTFETSGTTHPTTQNHVLEHGFPNSGPRAHLLTVYILQKFLNKIWILSLREVPKKTF